MTYLKKWLNINFVATGDIYCPKSQHCLIEITRQNPIPFSKYTRNLLHSVVVVNEVIDEAKKERKKCIVFKVNYEKAHDSVCWDFLFYMLSRLGYNKK